MYAVLKTGGKQYRVQSGESVRVELLSAEVGATVSFDEVLMVGEGESVRVGTPFIAGAKVKAGLLGKFPSLDPIDLANGDPKYTMDFRSVYAGILQGWHKTNAAPVLGRAFEPFPCVA